MEILLFCVFGIGGLGLGYLLGSIAEGAVAADLRARFAEEMARLQSPPTNDAP